MLIEMNCLAGEEPIFEDRPRAIKIDMDAGAGKMRMVPKTRKTFQSYYLDIKIDETPVAMKIDSGAHDSIINRLVWKQLGEPPLEPVLRKRLAASGAQVDVLGRFCASIKYDNCVYQLPLQVSGREDTRNLMGRLWFVSIRLNWNRLFHRDPGPRFLPAVPYPIPLLKGSRTSHLFVSVKIDRVDMKMMFDSGATQTKIGTEEWEMLGCPNLDPCRITIKDTANNQLRVKGQFTATVEYDGEEHRGMPVIVAESLQCRCVIGTNWYEQIKFDFNHIFNDLRFIR